MSAYEEMMAQRGDAAEPKGPTEPPEGQDIESDAGPEAGPPDTGSTAQTTSDGMARLLEIAARNADELLDEAKAEAEQVTSSAREEAERLLSEARSEVEKLHAESEKARDEANQAISGLRDAEREHRERMKSHLEEMLARVEANSIG
jgi:cell division septum initiation protein DivIVA